MRHVAEDGFHEAPVVDAVVFKEAAIFDGEHGMDEVRRDFVVGHQAALGAVGVFAEAGDEDGFELVAGEGLAVVVGDGIDNAAGDVDGCSVLGMVRLRAGIDADGSFVLAEGAHGRSLALPGYSRPGAALWR